MEQDRLDEVLRQKARVQELEQEVETLRQRQRTAFAFFKRVGRLLIGPGLDSSVRNWIVAYRKTVLNRITLVCYHLSI